MRSVSTNCLRIALVCSIVVAVSSCLKPQPEPERLAVSAPEMPFAAGEGLVLNASAHGLDLSNGRVGLRIFFRDGSYHQRLYTRTGSGWIPMLESAESGMEGFSDGTPIEVAFDSATVLERTDRRVRLGLSGKSQPHAISLEASLTPESNYVSYSLRDSVVGEANLGYLRLGFRFLPAQERAGGLDFKWAPLVAPLENDVIPDAACKTPAVMFQQGPYFAALLPNRSAMRANPLTRTALTLKQDGASPTFSYGFCQWMFREPGFFEFRPEVFRHLASETMELEFNVLLRGDRAPRQGYCDVLRTVWNEGRDYYFATGIGPQNTSVNELVQTYFESQTGPSFTTVTLGNAVVGGFVLDNEEPRGLWLDSRYQPLRTAYGMYLYGEKRSSDLLIEEARKMVRLAMESLASQQAFASVLALSETNPSWCGDSDSRGMGKDYFYAPDASWTCYWLLNCWDKMRMSQPEVLCKKYADFLISRQNESGKIPSWYKVSDGSVVAPQYDDSADTAVSAMFLGQLFLMQGDPRHLVQADKAAKFLAEEVYPKQKWLDSELFFGRPRLPLDFADVTGGQSPQSVSSMYFAAKAFGILYLATGKPVYLEKGRELLDYLCLFQQVWNPTFFSRNLFGGFGAKNTQPAWSEPITADMSVLLADYYDMTREPEYLERAVAALRSALSMSVPGYKASYLENWAGHGDDQPGPASMPDYGVGNAVAAASILTERFGDAFVDIKEGTGMGVSDCSIEDLNLYRDARQILHIKFNLFSPLQDKTQAFVNFFGTERSWYWYEVNGNPPVVIDGKDLAKGLNLATKRPFSIEFEPPVEPPPGDKPHLSGKLIGATPNSRAFVVYRARGGTGNYLRHDLSIDYSTGSWSGEMPLESLGACDEIDYYIWAIDSTVQATAPRMAPDRGGVYVYPWRRYVTMDAWLSLGTKDNAKDDALDMEPPAGQSGAAPGLPQTPYSAAPAAGFVYDPIGRGKATVTMKLSDLQQAGSGPVVEWAQTFLYSPVPVVARVCAANDDGMKLWVNDKLVISKHEHRGQLKPWFESCSVTLNQGWNKVVLAAEQWDGPDMVYLSFGVPRQVGEDSQYWAKVKVYPYPELAR